MGAQEAGNKKRGWEVGAATGHVQTSVTKEGELLGLSQHNPSVQDDLA